ncbi:MAG: type II toxin-antitoxin system MqsA family antitoxin [Rhodobacterales bacterium]|nr:type II toxin-antitoxin system MqsA family antitoxin [Rhodobacterales bacterium]MDX5391236.1 type II toxin-antitoxin system MqsA family antitoxin [Rhodobacterales bacterium]MDX5490937.1 type II toxin-antitoxin system MqsA family antitoxin [Rhodobacterales bacterium]
MRQDGLTRRHPETGVILSRGMRCVTLSFGSQRETIDLPGWYPADDPTAENGLHDARDMRVSDRAITLMKAREAGLLTPDQIRKVRKKLGLSQRDAGRIIGGGPNAFQKYEAGDVLVSKAADTALRLLANDPARLAELVPEASQMA